MVPQLFRDIYINAVSICEVVHNAVRNVSHGSINSDGRVEGAIVRGKTILITGGTSGIGFETAQSLVSRGADVIITSRSQDKGQKAVQEIVEATSQSPERGTVRCMPVRLDSLKDVKTFSRAVAQLQNLDIVVCNAGIMAPVDYCLTEDELELQFQVNHLSHAVISSEVAKEHLNRAAKGTRTLPMRIVFVSSVAAASARIQWDDLQVTDDNREHQQLYDSFVSSQERIADRVPVIQAKLCYRPFRSYAQSKLMNQMSAVELHNRCQGRIRELNAPSSAAVCCTSVHPGIVDTHLARNYFENDYLPRPLRPILRPVLRAVFPVALLKPELAVSTLDLAMFGDKDVVGQKYIVGNNVTEVVGEARSESARKRLWDVSKDLSGVMDQL